MLRRSPEQPSRVRRKPQFLKNEKYLRRWDRLQVSEPQDSARSEVSRLMDQRSISSAARAVPSKLLRRARDQRVNQRIGALDGRRKEERSTRRWSHCGLSFGLQ